jgi:uncharacterized protein (TIGR00369 family)
MPNTNRTADFIESIIANDEFLSWLNVSIDAITDDTLTLSVPYSSKIALNDETPGMGGTIHAGILSTLVDMAGEVLRLHAEHPEAFVLATTDLHTTFLRPATNDLTITGRIERVGNSMAVSDVRITSHAPDGTEKTVAIGRGSYRVLHDT